VIEDGDRVASEIEVMQLAFLEPRQKSENAFVGMGLIKAIE
jgi:hypothetical protein